MCAHVSAASDWKCLLYDEFVVGVHGCSQQRMALLYDRDGVRQHLICEHLPNDPHNDADP